MSTESVEEYLEAIHAFNEKDEPAKTTELAERLNVSPPSVTEMVKRLAEDGLVDYEPYKGATLTGKGMAYAERIVRKHRLLERFLVDSLGLKSEKVHDEACRLEHSVSDDVADAMCRVLEQPELCPDDHNPIPPCPLEVRDCDECVMARKRANDHPRLVTQLSNLRTGDEAIVAFVRAGNGACKRLVDMGLTQGTRVRVVNVAPFKGPVEIAVRDTTLALGRSLASSVFVEIKEGKAPMHAAPPGPHTGRRWRARGR
jgi:DtxR family Mn-dependent transcriptional regulator